MTQYAFEERPSAGAHTLVEVSGELDLTHADEVEQLLEGLSPNGSAWIALDLNRVLFIDSAALHVLFKTARTLGRERFALVVEPDAAVARTLAIVGMAEVATIVESTDDLRVPEAR